MTIEDFAWTKLHEIGVVTDYQNLQTVITTDIITLELLTHTPILTNTTTDVTLEDGHLTDKQIRKENRAAAKSLKKAVAQDAKKLRKLEQADLKASKKARSQQ